MIEKVRLNFKVKDLDSPDKKKVNQLLVDNLKIIGGKKHIYWNTNEVENHEK